MTLPSAVGGRTTEEVGYFECDAYSLAEWIRQGLDGRWELRVRDAWASVNDAVAELAPRPLISKYACVPVGRWTIVLTNGPNGTDVGVLPSQAARELGCRAVRAVSVGDRNEFPARILAIYGPEGKPPLRLVRSIVAAKDGDRWVFEAAGTLLPFEDRSAYAQPVKARRLTPEMVHDYLRALGVPVDDEPDWSKATLVEKVG